MRKLLIAILVALIMVCGLSSCGETYTCNYCDKNIMRAYYTMSCDREHVMCKDCAREYWMPFDYEDYRVK